mgnify:CR=1 FL=1
MYNPFREDSWQYLKQQMQPLLDGDKGVGKATEKFVIVCGHFIVGQQSGVQNVDERVVLVVTLDLALEGGIGRFGRDAITSQRTPF